MSIQQYALLSLDLSAVVQAPVPIDSVIYASWISQSNPKAARYRIINMIAQPGFDAATQVVNQNGWTITASDVQPVWVVQSLSAPQQAALVAQTNYNTVMAANIVAQCTNAITNWGTLNAAQKDTVLLSIVKVIKALLQVQFNINN